MDYTVDQQKVVDTRDADILVAAAAGSGKTQTLTGRIRALITDKEHPVDVDRLLIVTFTKAAAAEMRERIGKQIREALSEDPENGHLLRQEMLLHNAHICTIDSFCAFLVRNHYSSIGLDPIYRLMDEGEGKLLKDEVVHALMERHYQSIAKNMAEDGIAEENGAKQGADEESIAFSRLVECYDHTGKGSAIEEMILAVAAYADGLAEPAEFVKRCLAEYTEEACKQYETSTWWMMCMESAIQLMEENKKRMQYALRLMQESENTDNYEKPCRDLLDICERFLAAESYEEKRTILACKPGEAGRKKNQDKLITEQVKAYRNAVAASIKTLQQNYFSVGVEERLQELKETAVYTRELLLLVEEFMADFARTKRERKIVDFSDIEHFAYDILTEKREDGERVPTQIAKEYQEFFKEIMVDEYQDSSYLQEALLSALVHPEGKNHYFMVGDVKQSIYRFRNARPQIFLDKYHTFGQQGEKIRIDLNQNFRSREEVLSFANHIFEKIMIKPLGGIDYDEKARLYTGADYKEGQNPASGEDNRTEVLLVNKPQKSSGSSAMDGAAEEKGTVSLEAMDEAECSDSVLEARLVAKRIKKMMQNGFRVYDRAADAMRPVKYKDIVILVRSVKNCADEFREVFEEEGIPFTYEARTGFFHTKEVKDVVNLLKVIDNPLQDIPLYGVMLSHFGGFSEEAVAEYKAKAGEWETQLKEAYLKNHVSKRDTSKLHIQLYNILLHLREEDERLDAFLRKLDDFRGKAEYLTIRELLQYIFDETGYIQYMTAFPGGTQRKANLYVLMERAEAFEKTSFHGVFHFCRFLELMKQRDEDMGEAGILDEELNAVQLMTIHHSKGLEYPVCFISKIFSKFNNADLKGAVLCDANFGVGTDYINPDTRVKRAGIRRAMLGRVIKTESLAENIRTLYVAMTRAKEKMIFTGVLSGNKDADGKTLFWQKYEDMTVEEQNILAANSYGELLLLGMRAAAIHKKYLPDTSFVSPQAIAEESLSEEITKCYSREALEQEKVDEKLLEKLQHQMAFSYPRSDLKNLYHKTTVTDLKKKAYQDVGEVAKYPETQEEPPRTKPRFMKDDAEDVITGMNRGTAYHRLMELTSFKNLPEEAYDVFFAETKKQAILSERIEKEDAALVREDRAIRFYESAFARRMAEADKKGKLYKEKPFFMGLPANEVETDFPADEWITVQGVIDVYFEEEDGLVLMDYKTDAVSTGEELVKRYKTQLYYYQRALEQATGKKVKERVIYSFALGQTINV
ncbi:MAG: helicase-exonuclease AddAB subunit AddA [Lachnospiraceae bacterium]|nr:helicase-exonuclease AddAB subunit AddA [Lachnospiraceae bacterium]